MARGRTAASSAQLERLLRHGSDGVRTDGQLLGRFVASRDPAAFESLVGRHGAMVRGVCRSVLGDPHEAQDAFQATFLVLLRNPGAVRRPESVAAWLHGVARRVASRARRDAARRRSLERAAALRHETPAPPQWCPELHEEVDRLPDRYRAPVVLCGLEGHTHEEAARQLGWPLGTVKVRLMRGRARLRDRLTRRGLAPAVVVLGEAGAEASTHRPVGGVEAWGGAVSPRAAALAKSVSRSLFMSKIRLAASALVAAGTITLAAGWGLHRSTGAGESPTRKPEPAAEKPKAEARKNASAFDGRMTDAERAVIGNMRPLVKDERGVRFQTREAVLYKNGQVLLWEPWEKVQVGEPIRHKAGPIEWVRFLEGSKLLVTRSADEFCLWDGLTGQFKMNLNGEHVRMIDFGCEMQDSKFATISGGARSVTVWNAETLKPVATVSTAPQVTAKVALSRDGRTLVTLAEESTEVDQRAVQLWDVASKRLYATLAPPSPVVDLVYKDLNRAYKDDGRGNAVMVKGLGEAFWEFVKTLAP